MTTRWVKKQRHFVFLDVMTTQVKVVRYRFDLNPAWSNQPKILLVSSRQVGQPVGSGECEFPPHPLCFSRFTDRFTPDKSFTVARETDPCKVEAVPASSGRHCRAIKERDLNCGYFSSVAGSLLSRLRPCWSLMAHSCSLMHLVISTRNFQSDCCMTWQRINFFLAIVPCCCVVRLQVLPSSGHPLSNSTPPRKESRAREQHGTYTFIA